MEWSQATMELAVITSALGGTSLCVGFCLRARMERKIRAEYRELFGTCRRSMAQGNEYATNLAPSLDAWKTTEFRPQRPRSEPVHRTQTVECDLRSLARYEGDPLAQALTTEIDDA